MVGREVELGAGRRFLDAVESSSACLVFEGEAGIGKSTVWRETVALAEQRGHRVLACRPAPAEAKLSYAGLAELLAGVEPNLIERLPVPQRRALEIALLQVAPGPRAPEPRALFTAFSSMLSLLAEGQPVVVAIDDLQWLDRASQAAVAFVIRRLGDRRVGFLISLRLRVDAVPPPDLAHALQNAQPERLTLGPLSLAVLHLLISERLGRPLARPVLARIATACGGNPFYALEIAGEVARRGDLAPGETLPVPDDLFDLVRARIRRLPAATKDSLLTAAALRDPVLDLLDPRSLEKAEAAGLVQMSGNRVSFVHPLFATAMYMSASAERRRQVHLRLGAALTDPEERARHLALAAEGPSEEIATALELAADQARSRGAPAAAADLMELAAGLTPKGDQERRRARDMGAAESHFHAGHLSRARSLAEKALSNSPNGTLRGNSLRLLGEIRHHEDSFAEAIPLFEESLVQLGDDPHRVDVRISLAFAHISLGTLKAAAGHAQAAVEEARSVGDDGLYAVALAASALADFYLGRPLDRDRVELALAHEDLERQTMMQMRPSLIAGNIASLSDEFDRAVELLGALRLRSIERGDEIGLPLVLAQLSYIERQRGNLDAAMSFAREGCEIASTVGSHTAQALMLAERCFGRAIAGDVGGARADAEEALQLLSRVEFRLAFFWRAWALAFLETSLGNTAAAAELLAPLVAAVEVRGRFDPLAATILTDSIEIVAVQGELERGEALAATLEMYGHTHGLASALAAASRVRALLLAGRGDLAGAREAAEGALAIHERLGMALEVGRTLLVKGQIERRAKQKRAAGESLARALEVFERIGARLWSDRARAELARTGSRRAGSDDLTPTEGRVAELATQGLTAKQIGEAIFLSPKTVEANFSRIYSKLGIRSRAELGRVIAERDRATPE
jgi:DNA-binding CsgD family transcriptional regulator